MKITEIKQSWDALLKRHRLTFVTGRLSSFHDILEHLIPTQSSYSDPAMTRWIHVMNFVDERDPDSIYTLVNMENMWLFLRKEDSEENVFYFSEENPRIMYRDELYDYATTEALRPFIKDVMKFVTDCVPENVKKE